MEIIIGNSHYATLGNTTGAESNPRERQVQPRLPGRPLAQLALALSQPTRPGVLNQTFSLQQLELLECTIWHMYWIFSWWVPLQPKVSCNFFFLWVFKRIKDKDAKRRHEEAMDDKCVMYL